jgi:hypothetical protein
VETGRPARLSGEAARVDRIASAVKAGVPGGWPWDSTFVEAFARGLIVLQDATAFEAVERALDRLATVGGPTVRLHVDVLRDAASVAARLGVPVAVDGAWRAHRVTLDAAGPPASAKESLVLDVPFGRLEGATRSETAAYLADYSLEIPPGVVPDPVVHAARSGVSVTAGLGAVEAGGLGLDLDLQVVSIARPIGTVQAALPGAPATLESPAVTVHRFRGVLDALPGSPAYLLAPTSDGTSALLRLESVAGLHPAAAAAWRRVTAGGDAPAASSRVATLQLEVRTGARGSVRLTNPVVTVWEGQRATVQVLERTSYVRDLDVQHTSSSPIADPVIGTAVEGLATDFSVLPGDGAMRTFDVRLSASFLDRPFRVREVPMGATPARIQLPVSHDVVLPFRFALQPGEEKTLPPVRIGTKDGPKDAVVSIRYLSAAAVR